MLEHGLKLTVCQLQTLTLGGRLDLFIGGMLVLVCTSSWVNKELTIHCDLSLLVSYSFYDLVLGIEDPEVFIPPEECFQ